MKKAISLLLAVMLVLSLSATAFAAEVGSITINGVGTDATYEIYKLLDLESYDTTSGAYSYKVNSAWATYFTTSEALTYFTIDDAGYVTWIAAEDDDTVVGFAKKALAYAKANGIAPVKSSSNAGEFTLTGTTGKFADLELGYYLVDSTMGALCGLTTTNPDASINAKNSPPTIDKQVQEDSTGNWGDKNTADIGQIVSFRTTINVHAGAENYVLHDKMSSGLTFDKVTRVEHVVPETPTDDDEVAQAGNYEVVSTGLGDDCTFEVRFSKAFCDSLDTNDKIIVYYQAMLNRNAIVAGTGNDNTATLEYGEENTTTSDSTKTYTFSFDLVKTDSQNTLIDGAEFKIYDAATGGSEVAVVPLMENDNVTPVLDANGNPMYRRARADETGVSIVVKDGMVTIAGFDNGTYFLEETVAPAGYNKLTARQKFTISDSNLSAVFNSGIYSTGSGVHVVNKTGSMLPETGSFGTAMFLTIGAMIMMATGVLLVTKKRMSMIED